MTGVARCRRCLRPLHGHPIDLAVLWRFNARSDVNLDVVVLLRRRSEGGMNNFVRGCICHQEKGRVGRPSITEETVDRVREPFTRNPRKSVRRASQGQYFPSIYGSGKSITAFKRSLSLSEKTAIEFMPSQHIS